MISWLILFRKGKAEIPELGDVQMGFERNS